MALISKVSYCRYCSADAHDLRVIYSSKYTSKCGFCGKMLFRIPADNRKPYYYLKEMPKYERGFR